jgi:hypothetical protein
MSALDRLRELGISNPDNAVAGGVVLAFALVAVLVALRSMRGPLLTWSARTRWFAAACSAGTAVAWWRMDGAVEGRLLWSLNDQHGFAAADLFGLPPLALAAVVLLAHRPTRWIRLSPSR